MKLTRKQSHFLWESQYSHLVDIAKLRKLKCVCVRVGIKLVTMQQKRAVEVQMLGRNHLVTELAYAASTPERLSVEDIN